MDLTKEKILVTGANGFIGANLVRYLRSLGAEVFCLAHQERVESGIEVEVIDLINYDQLKKYLDQIKPTIVFHLGAYVVLNRDFETANICIDANIKGTLNLLEALKDKSLKRFIFMSTEEIFGNNELPFHEEQLPDPPSPYAITKVAGEYFVKLYHQLYNLPVVILRMSTTYGPYQPTSRFIPTIITQALKNEEILMNSGANRRNYNFVDDVIEVLLLAVTKSEAVGEIINIGQPESVSGRELVEIILSLSESSSEVKYNAFPDRQGEADDWQCSQEKANQVLGWQPQHSLEEGLKKTIEHYKDLLNNDQ